MATLQLTDIKLAGIRRGTREPKHAAEFYAWLLELTPESTADGFRLPCSNGELTIDGDLTTPVAVEFAHSKGQIRGLDPDGVSVTALNRDVRTASSGVKLDHISMNCGNLAATIAFYRELGLVLTWSGSPPEYVNSMSGFHEEPVAGADWVHVSGADGYLALMQADWQDYGIHNSNSGPPRFIHIGFSVPDVDAIAARLNNKGIPFLRVARDSIGDRLYLNDPDGNPRAGNNVELIQYLPGVARSGTPPYQRAAMRAEQHMDDVPPQWRKPA